MQFRQIEPLRQRPGRLLAHLSGVSAHAQHDLPHRAAADTLDAGQQLRLPCPAAAAVVPHSIEDNAKGHVGSRRVHLVHHLHLAAAVAVNPQDPAPPPLSAAHYAKRLSSHSTYRLPCQLPSRRKAVALSQPACRGTAATRASSAPMAGSPPDLTGLEIEVCPCCGGQMLNGTSLPPTPPPRSPVWRDSP